MVGDLMMLPVRVGVRVTRLWFRTLEESVSLTAGAAGRVVELLSARGPNGAASEAFAREPVSPAREPAPPDTARSEPARPEPQRDEPPPLRESEPAPPAPVAEPVHVSEEPVLVEELAEPGAEDGAGADVHVAAPWDGYEQMTAKQVIARLASADSAELTAVALFEAVHRNRQTIMNAVERELRNVNAASSRANQSR